MENNLVTYYKAKLYDILMKKKNKSIVEKGIILLLRKDSRIKRLLKA